MAGQKEHDEPRNLVEASTQEEKEAARTLEQAADSHETLQGYYAINNRRPEEEPTEAKHNNQKD